MSSSKQRRKFTIGEHDFLVDYVNFPGDIPLSDVTLPYTPSSPDEMPDGVYQYRPGQDEAVFLTTTLMKHYTAGEAIYLDAPTGSGKSVLALGILKNLAARGMIATADHALQEQYTGYPKVVSITGRRNWPCTLEPDKTAENAPCTRGILEKTECSHFMAGHCAYYAQVNDAIRGDDHIVSNYNWIGFVSKSSRYRAFMGGMQMIYDEAHAAEQVVRDIGTITVDYADWPKPGDDIKVWLTQHINRLTDVKNDLWHVARLEQETEDETRKTKERFSYLNKQQVATIDASVAMEGQFLPVVSRGVNGVKFIPTIGELTNLPVGLRPTIFMSATLVATELADPRPHLVIHLPNTFPKENRPIVPLGIVSMGQRAGDEEVRRLAQEVDALMLKHSNEKGVVHTVSFALAEQIYEYSTNKGMLITHAPGERDEALEKFKQAPPGRVLLTPSAMQGVDLPYDLCRWQLIAKVPFPNLGDEVQKQRAAQNPELYSADTVRMLVQAAGRGMRAPDDSCVTYIADKNFGWFYRQNAHLFPDWYREAVRKG